MCFSAEASFAVGTTLIPAGIYCAKTALRKGRRYLGLAVIPFLFAAQQFCEGVAWIGLRRDEPDLTLRGALGFLFFALAFWPIWIPFCAFLLETRPQRKALIGGIVLAGASWSLVLYVPIVLDPARWLTIEVHHHSLHYHYFDLPVYHLLSPFVLRMLYFLTIALPLAIGSDPQGKSFGLLLFASALVSQTLFSYAFVSVWCFFAACLSLYLCHLFYRLPESAAETPGEQRANR